MKIGSVRIQNLRSFSDATIPLNDYTCLVGPNGSGKSTVLCALNVFFREFDNVATDLSQLDREDFHQKNTDEPIRITITFTHPRRWAQMRRRPFLPWRGRDGLALERRPRKSTARRRATPPPRGRRAAPWRARPCHASHADAADPAESLWPAGRGHRRTTPAGRA